MQTINHIVYDDNLYRSGTYLASLLYETSGVALAIALPNANIMSFINPFTQIAECRDHVENNPRKIITLFAWNENMQRWLSGVESISGNLKVIKIFCGLLEQGYVNSWIKRYKKQWKNVEFDIISYDELNYALMVFGVDHLKRLYPDFPRGSPEYQQLHLNYKRVCRALANYFWDEANRE
ncbi:unnamed protein product [Adineta ricciae]|uniref:Uncharacterized protein n=1 Tax=Adineta ricciae TaxID=249248 RepID=A0A814MCJ4_ADIRI|nr:unnamed protein product [Adineta ricciae]CAF1347387.1 unnamed protein product [Adineta ricciae]